MAELLSLAGRPALSPFRLAKLLQSLTQAHSAHRIAALTADFLHFVEIARPLAPDERATLERLLTYGPAHESGDARAWDVAARRAAARHDLALVVQGHRHRAQLRTRCGGAHRARHALSRDDARRRRVRSRPSRGAAAARARPDDGSGAGRCGARPCACSPTFRRSRCRRCRCWRAAARRSRTRTARWAWRWRRTRSTTSTRASAAWAAIRPTSNSRCSRRPTPSTAGTRSSTPTGSSTASRRTRACSR